MMTKTKRMLCIILGVLFALSSIGSIPDRGFLSCLITFALSSCLAYWAYKKPITPSRKELLNQQLNQQYPYANSNFPQEDPSGNKFYRVYTFELTGSHFEKDGQDPQVYVRKISIGAPVLFKHREVAGYESAYLATDVNDNPLGWLPENDLNRKTVARRLDRGLMVLACVSGKTEFTVRGKTYQTLIVDVAAYELPKKSKD